MIWMTAAFLLNAAEPGMPTIEIVEHNVLETGFEQVILWRRYEDGETHVSEWMGCRNFRRVGDLVSWRNPSTGRCYYAVARIVKETSTRKDPEVEDRKKHPQEMRVPYFD